MVSETPELDGPTESASGELSAVVAWVAGRRFPPAVFSLFFSSLFLLLSLSSSSPLLLFFSSLFFSSLSFFSPQSEPRVRLTAELGKLPYSMEIGEGRRLIRRILHESARAPHGRIGLSEDDDIRLAAVSTPPAPFTPASLMATLTALLLDFQPYLDLLGRVLDDARRAKTAETAG